VLSKDAAQRIAANSAKLPDSSAVVMRAVADLRCGSRLDGFPFLQPPTNVCLAGAFFCP
jgi:hypothetical protein